MSDIFPGNLIYIKKQLEYVRKSFNLNWR